VPDHPQYKQLYSSKAEATCTLNYECIATTANRGPAKATVAILISNIAQCTGTLLNNTREDGRAYVLTARHCETGDLGGGTPGIASQISIYWDAVSPCSGLLGSLYSGELRTQSGARTVVEQQDAWLIELDRAPVIDDPYYAGWDATGGAFVGGYSVHHAMGRDKQFTSWHGQAILQHIPGRVLAAPYDSDFWGLVNEAGNVGPGASGGALFDPDNRVVGNASLAYLVGAQSDGVCPAATPPAPSPTTITAQYTALSAVWNSTADASSTTGAATLQSVLDPEGTGRLTLDGVGHKLLFIDANTSNQRTDQAVTFSWTAPWAQSCTATGGRPGDGWAGTKPTSGTAQVRSIEGGLVTYGLTCSAADRTSGKASAVVDWIFIPSLISLRGPEKPVMLGTPFELEWSSDAQPCTASGGRLGDGWAGAKSLDGKQTLQANQLGSVTYSYSCGTGVQSGTRQVTVEVVPPSITLSANATRMRIGSTVNIEWHSDAIGVCSGSGGVPSWSRDTQNVPSTGGALGFSDVPGTFTFTLTCGGGAMAASSSFTLQWVDEPATSSLTALVATQEIFVPGQVPPNLPPNLRWSSNNSCHITSIGPVDNRDVELQGQYPAGTATAVEFIAGHYEYELFCSQSPIQRVSIEWVAAHPQVTLVGPDVPFWLPGQEYQLFWTSNTIPCTASGGVPGDGWAGSKGNSVHNAQDVRAPMVPGTYTYSLTCGTGSSVGTTDFVVTVPPPAVKLTASASTQVVQQAVILQWDATTSPCITNADGTGADWGMPGGSFSGLWPVMQSSPGTYRYTITCGTGAAAVTASTQVTFRLGAPTELSASATTVPVNTPVTLTWQSVSTTCQASGGIDGDGWFGSKPPTGSTTVTSPAAQTVGYALDCTAGGQSVVITYTDVSGESSSAPRPSATLTSNRSSQVAGEAITLTWNSTNADACFAAGGSSGDGWAGSVSLAGTMSVTRSSAGSSTYEITCTGAVPAATAQTTVAFSAAPGTGGGNNGGSSGGGGGGGGALDRYSLLLLLLGLIARRRSTVLALP
jgi:hypothetical protein